MWLGGGDHPHDVGDVDDFGVAFHTTNNNVPFDEEHDICSLAYTEPMSLWLWMPQDMARTDSQARAHLQSKAKGGNLSCQSAGLCAIADENGMWCCADVGLAAYGNAWLRPGAARLELVPGHPAFCDLRRITFTGSRLLPR